MFHVWFFIHSSLIDSPAGYKIKSNASDSEEPMKQPRNPDTIHRPLATYAHPIEALAYANDEGM
jgi:hypothetical protein